MKNKLKHLLSAGDRLELYIDGVEGTPNSMGTSFEALTDNGTMIIKTPVSCSANSIQSNQEIRLTTSKDSAGILEMSGKIVQSTRTGSTTILVIELIDNIQQTQRRQYYRLPILRDVRLGNSGDGFFDGVTQNISAGGIRCILPIKIRTGAQITVKLELNREPFELKGEVLEALEFDENTQRFMLRVRFIGTSEKDRSKLISYIFSEQSRQNK